MDGKGKSALADAVLPETFTVDSCKLGDEFVDTSIIPGLRSKVIGKGVTATVKLMHRKGTGKQQYYAVKEFRRSRKENLQAYDRKVKLEFSIAKNLHHPNVVETIRLCSHAGRWSHVMEYCSQGDLFTIVQQRYLYSIGIAHRDIKLENLLLTQDSHLKITDFGCAKVFSELRRDLRSNDAECGEVFGKIRKCGPGVCGSLPYIAPEVRRSIPRKLRPALRRHMVLRHRLPCRDSLRYAVGRRRRKGCRVFSFSQMVGRVPEKRAGPNCHRGCIS